MRLLAALGDSTEHQEGGVLAGAVWAHAETGDPLSRAYVTRLLNQASGWGLGGGGGYCRVRQLSGELGGGHRGGWGRAAEVGGSREGRRQQAGGGTGVV